jgi:hypothetical protein
VANNFTLIVVPAFLLMLISVAYALITSGNNGLLWSSIPISIAGWTLGTFSGADFLIAAIVAIGVVVAIGGIIPTENTSGALNGARIVFFVAAWGVLSATAYNAIVSIPIFGVILYFALTAMFAFGVIQGGNSS